MEYRKSKGPSEYHLLKQNITYMKITTAQKGIIKLFPSADFLSKNYDLNIDGCFLGSIPLGALPSGHHLSNFCQRHAFQGAPASLGLCIYHSKLKHYMGDLLLYGKALLCLKRINKDKKGFFNTARIPMPHYQTYWKI